MIFPVIFFLLHFTIIASYDRTVRPKKFIKEIRRPQKHYGYLRDPEEEVEQQVYKIGALFDQPDSVEEIALKLAIERFNLRNEDSGIKFKGQIDYVEDGSYFVDPKACEILQEGVAGIFGPQNHQTASHVQSICDAFEVPHIETKWDYDLRREMYLMNLAPHPESLSHLLVTGLSSDLWEYLQALQDLVEALGWTRYIVLYENNDSLFRLQGVLQLSEAGGRAGYFMKLPSGGDYRPFLYELLDSETYTHFVIDCSPPTAYQILKQAQQVGFLDSKVSIIFSTLDLATLDLEDFQYSRALILAFRLINPKREEVKEIIRHWDQYAKSEGAAGEDEDSTDDQSDISGASSTSYDSNSPSFYERFDIQHLGRTRASYQYGRVKRETEVEAVVEETEESFDDRLPEWFTTDVALIFDAVDLLGHALERLGSIQDIEIPSLHCQSSNSWQQGYSVINYMKMSKIQGLTGWIQFNTTGFRTDVGLEIVQLNETGLSKAGTWNIMYKINWNNKTMPKAGKAPAEVEDMSVKETILKGKTLKVTTIMGAPMIMWKISETPLAGNDRYEGYAVDLVQHLADMYGFDFIINPVKDGKYGSQTSTGEWNGMVGEVMIDDADIAVADLTVNKQRAGAIDLTMPFMTLGISILFLAPKAKPPSLLSFIAPMENQVWLFVCAAIAGTTLTLYVCARLSPYEWIVPHPCIDDPDELENEFTLRDSFFFVVGTYLCQGAAIAPKTASTRMVAGFWWLFTLIMVSSYTANLATFLIVQDLDESIKSLEDLPKQNRVKYGCLEGGTTAKFFETQPFDVHKKIWANMDAWQKSGDTVLLGSNKAGVKRVVKDAGRYAFFMESTAIEYNTERNCKLHQVGGLLDNKGYAIGLKKGSNLTQLLNSGILKFQEKGVLDELKRKWWKEERKENACDDEDEEESEGSVQPLTLAHVGGVFIVLVVGCIVSIFISCFELLGSAMDLAEENNTSFCSELGSEIGFALSCKGTTKPVKKKLESEKDEESLSEKALESKSGSEKRSSSESYSSKEDEVLVSETLHVRFRNAK